MMRFEQLRENKAALLTTLALGVCGVVLAGVLANGAGDHGGTTGLPPEQYDVLVVGAGPGGIAASLQAARMGERVALLEETDWVGGQMTAAGVGTMDEGNSVVRKSGIYKEFADRAMNFYREHGKSFNTCYYGEDNLCVDPKLGQEILRHMLDEQSKNLTLYTGTHVSRVLKHGNAVTGVVAGGKEFDAKVVVDASEYGDVLDESGANYRIGNGTCTEPNQNACIQAISYVGIMKYYPRGVPAELRFTHAPPGYDPAIAKHFADFITANGNDHLTNPHNPLSFQSYAAFRGLPDLSNPQNYDGYQKDGHLITRTALIMGNDYPAVGVLSAKFLTDPNYRQDQTCKAKQLTLDLAYYIQHDLGQSHWSLANDEGYDTPYARSHHCAALDGYQAFENQLAQEPYIRESKRIVGQQTLAGNELQYAHGDRTKLPHYPNSVAVGYYPMDVHNCKTANTLEPAFDSVGNLSVAFAGGAFEVPMGVLIPETVDGLLAAEKNISSSRLANGAIREQPIAMDTGQAVGALAALAAQKGLQPRDVRYQDVQEVLKHDGAVVSMR